MDNLTVFKNTLGTSALLPLVPLKGIVTFPNAYIHIDVFEKKTMRAITAAAKKDKFVFLVSQRNFAASDISSDDIFSVGTIAHIKQVLNAPGDDPRVTLETIARAKVDGAVVNSDAYDSVWVELIEESTLGYSESLENRAMINLAQDSFADMAENYDRMPPETEAAVSTINDGGELADYIAQNIPFRPEDKQMLLETIDPHERLLQLISLMQDQADILSAEKRINEQVSSRLKKNQKDFYLREQIRAIQEELGESPDGPYEDEDELYNDKIAALAAPEEVKEKLFKDVSRLLKMPIGSQDAAVLRTYLDTCIDLPWGKYTIDTLSLDEAQKILDSDHYGLEKVKERILELLAVRNLTAREEAEKDGIKAQILCLVGPPGTGKTSVAQSVAKAMGREFVRVSLGGVHDEAEIRGHRRTYIGSMPGKIISAIIDAKVCNPVILLDEIDKLAQDYKGDPSSALLEVLDPEQNKSFRDNFIDIPFDLSKVFFITTANTDDSIPRPLLDRMDVIELSSYTAEEKFHIAKKYLVPKQLKANGMTSKMIKFRDDTLKALITYYTKEAGVRNLERTIASVCRKVARQWLSVPEEERTTITVKASDLQKYLGPKKFKDEPLSKEPTVGVVTGLAYTTVGGETMPIEVCAMDGSGKIELTGSLGDVMKESAKAAVSFIRSKADEYGIDREFYKKKDIHIHVPEGAVPKDGPSAGITMATALISELSGKPVRNDVAMTGEITLRGKVLPIGGLREKTMAAYKAGIKTVIIPQDNVPDLYEVEQVVKDNVRFVPAKTLDDVISVALAR